MEPVLDERDFVFCSFPTLNWDQMRELNPIGIFHEKEGVTFILDTKNAVDKKIDYLSVYRLITLNVHSSLDAVGLTAAFSAKLAEKILVLMWWRPIIMTISLCLKRKRNRLWRLFLNYKKRYPTQCEYLFISFIYSINRKMIRPLCGPFTHFGCDDGPHRSVEFTLLRTGGITFKTEIPLSGSV